MLKIKHLSKSFDQLSLYSDLNIDVFRGDRIGIIGPNGTGKSTLLKIIKRELLPDTGRLIFGENVHIGYYSQEADDTLSNHSETLIDALRTVNIKLSDGEIRNILAQFMFRNDEVFKTVNELSGGEKSRLRLAMLMISQANLLLLDEPTNHIMKERLLRFLMTDTFSTKLRLEFCPFHRIRFWIFLGITTII